MATVGDRLASPEIGWKRIDNTNAGIKYTGTWATEILDANHGGSATYTSTNGATATFDFYGTQLRIIGGTFSGRTTAAQVIIDGNLKGTINENAVTGMPQVLVFNITGLNNGKHTVQIKTVDTKVFLFDAIDIDNTGYVVGPLAVPEVGWKRYDDTNPAFLYSSDLETITVSGAYAGSAKYSSNTNANTSVRFKFKGTKLRIVTATSINYSQTPNKLSIDEIEYNYTERYSATAQQILVFEISSLSNTVHDVKVTPPVNVPFQWDVIDIDDTGRLFHPDEVTDIKDLEVGKRIRFNYGTTSGTVGIFSSLGKESDVFIPASSSAVPSGDAYFIMAVTDYKGRKILVSDRNVQHSITWDTLNSEGIASGSGVPLNGLATIPMMKSYISGNCTVSATTEFDTTSYNAWKAFDGSNTTYWTSTAAAMPTTESSLNITFKTPTVVNQYFLHARYSPKKWILEASNDNSTWTALHTGDETVAWHDAKKTFKFNNDLSYIYYRIRTTERHTWNSNYYNGFYTVQLYSTPKTENYSIRLLTGGTSSSDKDNEWDQYIVNGTGNGAFSPGDNTVWNWKDLSSATSTTSGAPGSRTTRGNTAAGAFSSTASNQGVAFRPILVVEPLFSSSYLISDGHSVKTYKSESGWDTVGTLPVTDRMFQDYGMTDLNKFVPFLKDLANTSRIEVLCCIDKESPSPNDVTITGVPLPQIVTMKDDLTFYHISHIDSVTLTADQVNNGAVRLAISVDSGETWEALDSTNNWSTVDITSRSHFKTNGMTIEQFNSFPDWTSKLSASQKLRISYYLELQSSSDIASITSLSLQVDLPNSWDKAIHGIDYHYGYTDTTNLRVRFMSDGDFKINVGSGSGASTLIEVDGGTF